MKNHDLALPLWGPYNKDYLGASHVANAEKGLRFDLNLFPGYYRRSVMSVRDLADSGTKMMASSTDVSRFVYRYELEWKDKVYVEADFKSDDNVMTVTCDFVNNTEVDESLHPVGIVLLASPYLMQHPNVAIALAVEPCKVIVYLICCERIDDWPVGYYQTA